MPETNLLMRGRNDFVIFLRAKSRAANVFHVVEFRGGYVFRFSLQPNQAPQVFSMLSNFAEDMFFDAVRVRDLRNLETGYTR